jgi:hypothetical protein
MQARSANVVNYRHRVSLDLLARDLDRVLSKQQKQVITLELIEKGLMLMPWWLRLIKLACSADKWKLVMYRVWDQHDDLLDSMWRDSMTHMTRGKDRVDPKSAGGYNGDEMKIFTDLLDRVGYMPGNNLVMTALRDGFFQDSGLATAQQLKEEFSLA